MLGIHDDHMIQKQWDEKEKLLERIRLQNDKKYLTFITVSLYGDIFLENKWEKIKKITEDWCEAHPKSVWCLEQRTASKKEWDDNYYMSSQEDRVEGKGYHLHILGFRKKIKPSYFRAAAISKWRRFCNKQANMIDVRFKNNEMYLPTLEYMKGIKKGVLKAKRVDMDKYMRAIYKIEALYTSSE